MTLHRFFVENKVDGSEVKVCNPKMIHQWKDVFRLVKGDQVTLFDNTGFEFLAKVQKITKQEAVLEVLEKNKREPILKREVTLCASIIKKDKFEWVVQKATELGVSKIVPIISERTEKLNLNMERLQKIAIEASEQSGRVFVPKILFPIDIKESIKDLPGASFVLDMKGEILLKNDLPSEVNLYVGPEGGWGDKDRKLFEENKIKNISLGDPILRAETASISVLSLLLLG